MQAPRSLGKTRPEVRHHQRVLEGRVGARVEAVHPAEALAGGTSAQHLHVALLRQLLAQGVGLLPGHDQLQQDVAVLGEDRGAGVVESEGLSGGFPHLDGPQGLRDACGRRRTSVRRWAGEGEGSSARARQVTYQPGGSLRRVLRSRRTRPAFDTWALSHWGQSESPELPEEQTPFLCPSLVDII